MPAYRSSGEGCALLGPQLALLRKLLQLLHKPAGGLLVLLAQLPPDRIVGGAITLILCIERSASIRVSSSRLVPLFVWMSTARAGKL